MKAPTAKAEVLNKGLAIDHEQFEQLCRMVIERVEPPQELELTPFRGDGGIDIHAVADHTVSRTAWCPSKNRTALII